MPADTDKCKTLPSETENKERDARLNEITLTKMDKRWDAELIIDQLFTKLCENIFQEQMAGALVGRPNGQQRE